MKKLTKIFLIILTTLTMGVGINKVEAKEYKIKDKVNVSFSRGFYKEGGLGYFEYKNNQKIARNNWNYQMYNYVIDNDNMAYCLDATYNDSVGTANEITNVYDPYQYAYDAALYAILENGANSINSSNEDKAATEIALRAFVEGVAMDGWATGGDLGDQALEVKFAANANIAIYDILPQYSATDIKKILNTLGNTKTKYQNISECNSLKNGTEISTCFQKLTESSSSNYSKYKYYAAWPTSSADFNLDQRAYYFNITSVTNKAKELLKKGIEAVINFSENNSENGYDGDFDVQLKLKSTSSENPSSETNETTEVKYFTFSITNVEEENILNNIRVECPNCASNGVTIEKTEYQNGDSWETLTPSIDLAKLVEKNGDVDIRVTIRKSTLDSEECEPVSMNILYDVYEKTGKKFEMYKIQATGSAKGNHQRYLAVKLISPNSNNDDSNKVTKQEKKSPDYPINTNCDKKPEPCETNLTTPICAEDENGIAKVEAPEDIKKCIINNTDDATNEYRLSDNNGGINNNYCGTFCKEDYREISLNKALNNVNCGGYFKLQARIEGSKDCYRGSENTSDKSIDTEQYTRDIVAIQQNLILSYDRLLKATAASGNSDIKSKCTKYATKKEIDPETKEEKEVEDTSKCEETTWTLSGSYIGVAPTVENRSTGIVTLRSSSGSYSYSSTVSAADISSQISRDMASAKSQLTSLNTQYENTIKQFNSCTSEWNSKYNFDPKVYWEYSENFDNELDKTNNDLLSKDDRVLAPVESTRKDSNSLQACTGTTDSKIETCSTGWTSTDSVFASRDYTRCDESGCLVDTVKVSQAKFIKQHFEVEQDYDTPTVYYQVASSGPLSGSITTYKDFNNPNVPLSPIDGLPLSGDTTGGGVFKLMIEDLGEFYDSGEQGRLIDFGGDNDSRSVAYAKGYNADGNWSGEYVCHYYTNCRPKDCPNCNFVCVGEYCEWEDCPTCNFDCVNCIYNFGELQLNMKPVSTTEFNESAGREYGYNWNINTSLSSLELIRDKAEETIKEIEENNTTIYDDTNTESSDSKLEFRFTMTPEIAQDIKEYNAEKDSVGGYNDSSLVCYDYEDENGVIHKNTFCYSTFIDNAIAKYGKETVYTKDSRGSAADRTNESVVNSGYWTPWSEYGSYNESVIGGPSWK